MKTSRSTFFSTTLSAILVLFIFMGTAVGSTSNVDTLVREALLQDLAQSSRLLHLPYAATFASGAPLYVVGEDCWLLSLDLDRVTYGDQQSITVLRGSTITVTGEFQMFDNWNITAIRQAFFVFSWTMSWPPPAGYYHGLYSSEPGAYPGVTRTFNFDITIPNERGVYFLYFCTQSHYSIPQAIASLTVPLWIPYAVIVAAY